MSFSFVVSTMDLPVVAALWFCGALIEGRELLAGNEDALVLSEKPVQDDASQVLALLIVENNENSQSEEIDQSIINMKPRKVPFISSLKPNRVYTDSSGDSNSDEYDDSDELDHTDTDSESNYYHEDDYKNELEKLTLEEFMKSSKTSLRKRWRSCQKKASKVCRKACTTSYKNVCEIHECKKKMKRALRKDCKRNCKDLFMAS